MKNVRVRFAPSPTGALHIGGVRTALFNYFFAKKHGGKMVLRIEDTDRERFVEGAESYIQESLKWVGITIDEGIEQGGEFGPYKQSERKAIYKQYADKLLQDGNAYIAFDTKEELDEMRARLQEAKVSHQQYNAATRMQMKNSLTLTKEEVDDRLAKGEPYVVRVKVPIKEEIRLNDMIRGWVHVHASTLDDKVILKSDGMPTYHLASVVDDHLMKITHIIRGEEWLPSAPLHVLLYKYLGWEAEMPEFAHLPLILKPDGKGKLSKRAADQLGFPVFPLNWTDPESSESSEGFMERGFLPETMVNFLALLGWNDGTDKELFTMEELCSEFSVEKIGKAGAKFDIEKANWFNQQYIKEKSLGELLDLLSPTLRENNIDLPKEKLLKIVGLMQERISFATDIWTGAPYFFMAPQAYDAKVVKKKWTSEAVHIISAFKSALEQEEKISAESVRITLDHILESEGIGIGRIMQALRVAVTGVGGGPDLMEIIEIIGKDECVQRLENALEALTDKIKQ